MANSLKHNAFSLVELLVVLGIIAALTAFAIPAFKAMQKSYDSTGAESMITAALSSARTLAISKQRYAGVRFQKVYDANNVLNADQYMIFIVDEEEGTHWDCGFAALENYKPIQLPSNVSVMDKIRRVNRTSLDCGDDIEELPLSSSDLANNVLNVNMTDTSTFVILFSPTGKMVSQRVRCRHTYVGTNSVDVFNERTDVESNNPTGMFIEDNNDDIGLGVENSRKQIYIYDKDKFKKMTDSTQRWNYLDGIKPITFNPYTGEIIK